MYDPTQPSSKDSPKSSTPQIQINFSNYATSLAANHGSMNSVIQGKHTAVVMKQRTGSPAIQDGFASLFCRQVNYQSGADMALVWKTEQKQSNMPTNSAVALTYPLVELTTPFQTFLSGPFIVYMGTSSSVSGISSFTVTLPVSAPTSQILFAQACMNNNVSGSFPFQVTAIAAANNLSVTFYFSAITSTKFNYIIIGAA